MQIERYMGRISGPLLDRIDLHIEVPSVPFQELAATADGTSSAAMREQVQQARDGAGAALRRRQPPPQQPHDQPAAATPLRRWTTEGQELLKTAMEELGLSARAHDRILRVARTIADLEEPADIQAGACHRGDRLPQSGSEAVGTVNEPQPPDHPLILNFTAVPYARTSVTPVANSVAS